MITISNLTPHQLDLLQKIWQCKTLDELTEFQLTLDEPDIFLSFGLMELLRVEYIDQEQAASGDISLARKVLSGI